MQPLLEKINYGIVKIKGGENEVTDLLMATANCEAFRKILLMIYPREVEGLTFNQIKVYSEEYSAKEKVGHSWTNQVLVIKTRMPRTHYDTHSHGPFRFQWNMSPCNE